MTDALVEAVALATLRTEYGLPECDPCTLPIAMHRHRNNATAALQAIEAAGYRVVPVEASQQMLEAAYDASSWAGLAPDGIAAEHRNVWSAMLSAAPRVGEG